METSSLASIFADYQRTITFQISGDQDPTSQIAELDFLYIRLCENKCDILSVLKAITLLFAIPHSWNFISASILFFHIYCHKLYSACISTTSELIFTN